MFPSISSSRWQVSPPCLVLPRIIHPYSCPFRPTSPCPLPSGSKATSSRMKASSPPLFRLRTRLRRVQTLQGSLSRASSPRGPRLRFGKGVTGHHHKLFKTTNSSSNILTILKKPAFFQQLSFRSALRPRSGCSWRSRPKQLTGDSAASRNTSRHATKTLHTTMCTQPTECAASTSE